MPKIIAHIDLNAFFATAEELRHPELVGKPIAVGGTGRRGVVSTANYVARSFGVSSAMPGYLAKERCPELIFLPVDFDYYEMLSSSFFNYLKRYSPLVEPASIDEGYVDMTKALEGVKDPVLYFRNLQAGLEKEIGLKCSIGVAPNRFLAKMASDMQKPMGLVFLRRRDIEKVLYPMPISAFWGIGRKSAPILSSHGIKTIGDLAKMCKEDDPWTKAFFGKSYETVKAHALGYGSDIVSPIPDDPKSIGRSRTLPYDIVSYDEIAPVIEELALQVSSSLKAARKEGKTLTFHLKDSDFKSHSKSFTSREPFFDADSIYDRAISLFTNNYLGTSIRLLGISISGLTEADTSVVQMNFDDYEIYEKKDATKLLVQEFNRRLDGDYLKLLSEVKDGNKPGHR